MLLAGVLLLIVWLSAQAHREISTRVALWQFESALASPVTKATLKPVQAKGGVDFSLWAQKRIQAYKSSLLRAVDPPLAVLEIARIKVRAPVFNGTDDLTLNRGVGHITGTAMPGPAGNVGIAGHRDGFFRGLKDIAVGDEVDLVTKTEEIRYVVDQIEIVDPADVDVLQPRSAPSLTLVTCYPFYFVGAAPKRFIVHASITSRQQPGRSEAQPTTLSAVAGRTSKENSK